MIRSFESSDLLNSRLNLVDANPFKSLFDTPPEPVLANNDLRAYSEILFRQMNYLVRSIAIIPLSLDGQMIGSLNLGDPDKNRFQPDTDTSFLKQLSLIVSICLSNVTAHEKIRYLAYHDPLTGLLNRRVMEKALKREFIRSQRYDSILSVAFVDLDDFKKVNDTKGHEYGDKLLTYVAQTLEKKSRETDIVARFAGDEFVLLLPETDAADAENLVARLYTHLRMNPFVERTSSTPISLCYGIASTEEKSIKDPSELLKKADERLYEAKGRK
jgi:diguanylate cyclase (GGDEF)-like protein